MEMITHDADGGVAIGANGCMLVVALVSFGGCGEKKCGGKGRKAREDGLSRICQFHYLNSE